MRVLSASVGLLLATILLTAGPLRGQTSEGFAAVAVGASVEGRLIPGGPTLAGRGSFVVHRFEGRAGVRYQAEARSGDFDAYLILARPVGGLTEFIQEDDDGAGESDARLRFTLEQAGTHFLVVQSLGSGGGGAFTLTLEERALPPPAPPRAIAPGESVQGRIDETSGVFLADWGAEIPYDLWVFDGRGGDHFLISMDSDDFDAYLEFGPMSGDSLLVQEWDDDGAGGTNALLRLRLPHDGRFGVRARPLSENAMGAYTLRVAPFTPLPPQRRPIRAGESVSGSLNREDAVLEGSISYQEWIYEGREGERLRIRMRSDAFDPYLSLGRERSDGSFEELAVNDDAPDDGVNSLIEFRLPATGAYVIRVRPYITGIGAYTLELVVEG